MGESDHQTSNGEYDEDTSGFEDDTLIVNPMIRQEMEKYVHDNLNSDGNFYR